MNRALTFALTVLVILLSGGVAACVMGSVYNLPIPFGMYASGSAAALVASFVIVAFVLRAQRTEASAVAIGRGDRAALQARMPPWLVSNLAGVGVLGLLLTIAAGARSASGSSNSTATFFGECFAIRNGWGITRRLPCTWRLSGLSCSDKSIRERLPHCSLSTRA